MPSKPTMTLASLSKLDGAAAPEPFTLGIAGRVVTFPDPLGMSIDETERFMAGVEGADSLSAVFKEWLSGDDYAVVAKHLTARQAGILMRKVQEHYGTFLGSPGEGPASTTA